MITNKPEMIYDKNVTYTPEMIDRYLPTFKSASRPNIKNKKKTISNIKDNVMSIIINFDIISCYKISNQK